MPAWNRKCVTCQGDYVATHAQQKYCSSGCRFPAKDCEVCGTAFSTPNIRTQRYCSKRCSVSVRDMAAIRALAKTNRGGAPAAVVCKTCGTTYAPSSSRQLNCAGCSPTKGAQARLRRYGISAGDWAALVSRYDGLCWLCRRRDAHCVDHSHTTGAVRGALCRACNMALGFMEDADWARRATEYLAARNELGQ